MHSETINISLSLRWLNNSQEAKYSRAEQPRRLGWILCWTCLWDSSQGWDLELRFLPGWGREALGALDEVQQFPRWLGAGGAAPTPLLPQLGHSRTRGGTLGPGVAWLRWSRWPCPHALLWASVGREAQAWQCLRAGTEPGPLVPELLKAPGSGSSHGVRQGAGQGASLCCRAHWGLHLAQFPSPAFWHPRGAWQDAGLAVPREPSCLTVPSLIFLFSFYFLFFKKAYFVKLRFLTWFVRRADVLVPVLTWDAGGVGG